MLRKKGHVAIRNTTRESDFPDRYFLPGLKELIDAHLPPRQDLSTVFNGAGFKLVDHKVITQITAPD